MSIFCGVNHRYICGFEGILEAFVRGDTSGKFELKGFNNYDSEVEYDGTEDVFCIINWIAKDEHVVFI